MPSVAKVLYWLIGAPAMVLAVIYVGMLPIILVAPFASGSVVGQLIIYCYTPLIYVAAAYLTWSCWRALRGEALAAAFRPFAWRVWVTASALGIPWWGIAVSRAA